MPSNILSFAIGIARVVIIAWGLSLRAFAIEPNCNHDVRTFRCVKYIKNYDADTITFNIPNIHPLLGEKISVRVAGIDAAEIKTKDKCEKESALAAKNFVMQKLKNAKRIDLTNIERDKYFRILADVIIDGKPLKDLLLNKNLAYVYSGKTKRKIDWCEVLNIQRLPASK